MPLNCTKEIWLKTRACWQCSFRSLAAQGCKSHVGAIFSNHRNEPLTNILTVQQKQTKQGWNIGDFLFCVCVSFLFFRGKRAQILKKKFILRKSCDKSFFFFFLRQANHVKLVKGFLRCFTPHKYLNTVESAATSDKSRWRVIFNCSETCNLGGPAYALCGVEERGICHTKGVPWPLVLLIFKVSTSLAMRNTSNLAHSGRSICNYDLRTHLKRGQQRNENKNFRNPIVLLLFSRRKCFLQPCLKTSSTFWVNC